MSICVYMSTVYVSICVFSDRDPLFWPDPDLQHCLSIILDEHKKHTKTLLQMHKKTHLHWLMMMVCMHFHDEDAAPAYL